MIETPYLPIYPRNPYGVPAGSAGVLGQTGATPGNGILGMTQNPLTSMNPFSGLSMVSQNRRSNAPLSGQPAIGQNEALMRIGGAIMGGAQQGGLNARAAGLQEYGAIQDYNRSQALAEYNAAVNMAKAQKAKTKKASDASPATPSPYNAIVIEDIERALAMLEKNHNFNPETGRFETDMNPLDNVTGFGTTVTENIGGTPAQDFLNLISTIVSSIGFDRLQKMRDDSPTGGALGQVSERELSQLNASLGSLENSQSPAQMRRNLQRVLRHYEAATAALENEYIAAGMKINPRSSPGNSAGSSSSSSNITEADKIVGIN